MKLKCIKSFEVSKGIFQYKKVLEEYFRTHKQGSMTNIQK